MGIFISTDPKQDQQNTRQEYWCITFISVAWEEYYFISKSLSLSQGSLWIAMITAQEVLGDQHYPERNLKDREGSGSYIRVAINARSKEKCFPFMNPDLYLLL